MLAVSPLPPPCAPPVAVFAIKMQIQFDLGGCRVGIPGERFTSHAFRGKLICFSLRMLSPLYDGGDDDTRIST